MKAEVICYDSIDKILGCIRVALVYTDQFLVKEKIPEYSPTGFELFTYVNRSIGGYKVLSSGDVQLKFFIDLNTLPDYIKENFMFNYVFFLNQRGETTAISRLPSTIETGDLSTETVTIIFQFSIDQSLIEIELNASEIPYDFDLHTKNLINKGAVVKTDIDQLVLLEDKPYTSNIIKLREHPDKYIMKYSGSIIKDKKFINPIELEVNDLTKVVKIFISKTGNLPKLVLKDGNTITIDNEFSFTVPNDEEYVDISYDYILTRKDNRLRIRQFSNPQNGFIDLIESMNYVIDSFTGELYFYRDGLDGHTYATSVGSGNYAMEVYCSSKLQKILENLANGQSSYSNSVILHHKNKSLLEITEGLAIYKDTTNNNKYVFHSHFTLNNGGKYFTVPEEYVNEIMLSNRAVLLETSDGKYYLYELVHDKSTNKFNWVKYYIGIDGCLHNIYMLAKQRESNPTISLTRFAYRGNIFRYDNNKLITL